MALARVQHGKNGMFVGYVDISTARAIAGWAWNTEENKQTAVVIKCPDSSIVTVEATSARPDVGEKLNIDQGCGFTFSPNYAGYYTVHFENGELMPNGVVCIAAERIRRRHYVEDYQALVKSLFEQYAPEEAASLAVGGHYDVLGDLEIALLCYLGVDMASDIIDVGCGSGRLATKLAPNGFTGSYLGTDVVPELLNFAQERSPTTFRFEQVEELRIPADDCSADVVTVFSVFTHLRHEESYIYLREMYRVLRPQGCVILSFYEFADYNWSIFEDTAKATEAGTLQHLNVFIERKAIELWSEHLGFSVERFICGNDACIPTDRGPAAMFQSIAVLRKLP